ncbi:PREDICTED: F-box protein SKIP27 [Camelina sativa]|uniref:F-box protein SKIP27 n=1 Tax=Camelina sativa TaxID=90675 RepID=A0ABM0UD96_CAMSA|nr:PREDICTED: F-box protein SKIP27 [Camelina sativa]
MIHYLHFIGEFWFSCAAKVVEWFSEKLLSSRRSRRTTMALTKRGFVVMKSNGEEEELELGLGSVRFTRGLGRKRILISSSVRQSLSRSAVEIPVVPESPPVQSSLKRQRSRRTIASSEKSRLESLPQDLFIRVICGVDHDDLKSLKLVSKSIREASLVAKSLHFAYTTPRKTRAFRNSIDLEEFSDSSRQEDDIEPPNAPNHYRWTKAKRREQLSSVSVALFT